MLRQLRWAAIALDIRLPGGVQICDFNSPSGFLPGPRCRLVSLADGCFLRNYRPHTIELLSAEVDIGLSEENEEGFASHSGASLQHLGVDVKGIDSQKSYSARGGR